jgi:hypothetical protein
MVTEMLSRVRKCGLGVIGALALLSAALLPVLPAEATMIRSSGHDMAMQCPSCHLASDCSGTCSMLPVQSVMSATTLVQTPLQVEPSTLRDSFASALPKPPPRSAT